MLSLPTDARAEPILARACVSSLSGRVFIGRDVMHLLAGSSTAYGELSFTLDGPAV
jgi:hypothetical protein